MIDSCQYVYIYPLHCVAFKRASEYNRDMNPYGYLYGYHPAPLPVDPGGSILLTTNPQGVAMMAPHGYISAAPTPTYPVYNQGVGTVPLGGSISHIAAVPSAWGMQYSQGMAGVEYLTVSTTSGAHPLAMPVTLRKLKQLPST